MSRKAYYIINGITWYRVITAPLLIALMLLDRVDIFKWLLPVSFFTDAIDGFLARKFKVNSSFGARLDSIGDDLTVAAGVAGIFIWKPEFIRENMLALIVLLALFLIQLTIALSRFRKPTSFHTWLANLAAIAQGIFIILFFFVPDMPVWAFYIPVIITGLDLLEEIILVQIIPKWTSDVKGIYWYLKSRNKAPG